MFKNTMKTTVLLAAMGGLIVAVAGLIGGGSTASLTIGLGLALVMVGGSYWFSDKLALASAKAHVIQREEAPEFYDIVASLASRAGMPMPRVAISPSEQPAHSPAIRAHARCACTRGRIASPAGANSNPGRHFRRSATGRDRLRPEREGFPADPA